MSFSIDMVLSLSLYIYIELSLGELIFVKYSAINKIEGTSFKQPKDCKFDYYRKTFYILLLSF